VREESGIAVASLDAPLLLADPYPYYAELRRRGPVHRVKLDGLEVWLVVRYGEAFAALADRRLSKDPRPAREALRQAGVVVEQERSVGFGPNMLMSDPPDHTRLRKLVLTAFTPRRVERLRPRIQEIADCLLDAVAPRGRADLIDDLAFPLPVTVICELLGVPVGDRHDFRAWTSAMLMSLGTPEARSVRAEGIRALRGYFTELVAERRPRVRGDLPSEEQPDLVAALIAANDHGGRLDEEELIGMLILLLVAGHETTVNLIGNGMLALLRHPDQLALLRGCPGLLGPAVEEVLRYDGPAQRAPRRGATAGGGIGDVTIPAGSVVVVVIGSADRDADRFEDPETFDIRRAENPHIAFGHGIHFCLGAPLARVEGEIAIGTLLARFPDLTLDAEADRLPWHGGFLRGLTSLPVRFTAPTGAGH
jgi:cytochrome P450